MDIPINFNPAIASENIKNEYIDYICTRFSFSNTNYQEKLRTELEKTVSAGPYIEIKDVFKTGKTIDDLINQNTLSPLFRKIEASKLQKKGYKIKLPLNRPLYAHQEEAVLKAVNGRNLIVSTGTGSGKTECFLLPILNELLREKENGTLNDGVRALLIYPMNALANDQLKRLREILMFYPDITFGVYNGNTEYEEDRATSVYKSMFANEKYKELQEPLKNEKLSRDEIKKHPPHLLFTNYAMLEHLLLRPNDDVIFTNADFKFVVLDEAHIYNGATGIETAMLLRRLKARITSSRSTQFILTSATLGNGEENNKDVIKFAQNLCGENFEENDIITAKRECYSNNANAINYPISLFEELADASKIASEILKKHGINFDKNSDEKSIIYDIVSKSTLYNKMRLNLLSYNSNCVELNEFSLLMNLSIRQTISFISLCTRAVKNNKALIDAKYHFFVRSLEGCYITLYKNREFFLNRKQYIQNKNTNEKIKVFEIACCNDCGKIALVGKIEQNKLIQCNQIKDEVEFFTLYNEQEIIIEDDDENEIKDKKTEDSIYYLCPKCGNIIKKSEFNSFPCICGKDNYITLIKSNENKCNVCKHGKLHRFYLGTNAATSVLATSLYEELPEVQYQDDEIEIPEKNIFLQAIQKKKTQKLTGRQFLVFSDSRQEAAKFACYMTTSYNEFLRRRGIWHIINNNKQDIINNKYSVNDFVELLTNYFCNKRSFSKSNSDKSNLTIASKKQAWVAMLNELFNYRRNTSFVSLGQMQFEYLGNESIIDIVANKYNLSKELTRNFLNALAFEVVKSGAIIADESTDLNDDDRKYIFYVSNQIYLKKAITEYGNKKWMPRNRPGQSDKFYNNYKLLLTSEILKINHQKANKFLEEYFDYFLTHKDFPYHMIDPYHDESYVMPAKNFRVKINGDPTAKWYMCQKCGSITQFNLMGKCPKFNCDGKIVEVNPNELCKNNHYANLYKTPRMSPLFIKEHTAQLNKKESADYQQQFIKKDINALSCSTTFEMGVDVGDLETVFLRNVPPLPSNYAQRAGRAGRSLNSAAYSLTFAKLSSHDFAFFKNPKTMICGQIMPPIFKLDNDKIIKRHINAIALSMFFAENEDIYNHNDAIVFLHGNENCEKGYIRFSNWLKSKPERLKIMIKKSLPKFDKDFLGIDDFSWINYLIGENGQLNKVISEYENNILLLNKLIKTANRKKDNISALKYEKKLKYYKKNRLIDFLARNNILPLYGFPVNTVELKQNTGSDIRSNLRLNRDLQIAIAEYAPSSEIVADGRLYTSRYINKSSYKKQDWNLSYICECENENCKTLNYSIADDKTLKCKACGEPLKAWKCSIEPVNGFTTEKDSKPVPQSHETKNFKSEDYYIGDTSCNTIEKYKIVINDIEILIESTSNDKLLVKSNEDFYVCKKCGFAKSKKEFSGNKLLEIENYASKIEDEKFHKNKFGVNCDCKILERIGLHHTFSTDVAKITFLNSDTSDFNTMLSVSYAILNSISEILNIERNDIKACLDKKRLPDGEYQNSIIIYDCVPGGAGHARRIVTKDGKLLHRILKNAQRNMHSCNCDPSCYNCLRNYFNQKIHDNLNRHLADEFLSKFC